MKRVVRNILVALFVTLSIPVALAEDGADVEIGIIKESDVRYVTSKEAASLIEQRPEMIVLDVRTAGEFRGGHIEGAINVSYFSFRFRKRLEELDPDAAYLVHCKSGHRSDRSVAIMLSKGIKDITHLDGGFDAWKDADLPFVSDKPFGGVCEHKEEFYCQ